MVVADAGGNVEPVVLPAMVVVVVETSTGCRAICGFAVAHAADSDFG